MLETETRIDPSILRRTIALAIGVLAGSVAATANPRDCRFEALQLRCERLGHTAHQLTHVHIERTQIGPRALAAGREVLQPELGRIHADGRSDIVHMGFFGPDSLRPAD